jgi:hypothetical protein
VHEVGPPVPPAPWGTIVAHETIEDHRHPHRRPPTPGTPVNGVDRYLQRLRINAALPWIPSGGHVLDVGTADGALFDSAGSRIASGVGIDPEESTAWVPGPFERRTAGFPDAVQEGETFDAIVMLAVIEHVEGPELTRWAAAVPGMLRSNGRLVITVPSPLVDHILVVGKKLRLLDGMETHQHHGFDPTEVPAIFSGPRMRLTRRQRFELGLNHLFVFSATG